MNCPLLAAAVVSNPDAQSNDAKCMGEQCAWWSPLMKQCMIHYLAAISGLCTELAKLPRKEGG